MRKILLITLCCLCLFGCGKEETNNSNEYFCNKIRYYSGITEKSILQIEYSIDAITNVISNNIIERKDKDLNKLKDFAKEIDYVSCELGDYNYCNTYVLEDSLVIVQETAFLPAKTNLTEYLMYIQENGYICTQYSIFKDTNNET